MEHRHSGHRHCSHYNCGRSKWQIAIHRNCGHLSANQKKVSRTSSMLSMPDSLTGRGANNKPSHSPHITSYQVSAPLTPPGGSFVHGDTRTLLRASSGWGIDGHSQPPEDRDHRYPRTISHQGNGVHPGQFPQKKPSLPEAEPGFSKPPSSPKRSRSQLGIRSNTCRTRAACCEHACSLLLSGELLSVDRLLRGSAEENDSRYFPVRCVKVLKHSSQK